MGIRRKQLSLHNYVEGVLQGNQTVLARAITLIESKKREHNLLAQEVLNEILPHTGNAARIGISGTPGVGKSTFIESFGNYIIGQGKKIAVLAIDPSSNITGGSILGDKTRMVELAANRNAFVRPTPSEGALGGVARKTREALLLCEAAGFDVVIVETVGVGQSETTVSQMVDMFLLLMQPGGGDELQGIKRGVLEMADMLAINKADGPHLMNAKRAHREYEMALHILRCKENVWVPPVVLCSAYEKTGLDNIWQNIEKFYQYMKKDNGLNTKRRKQLLEWMWGMVQERLMSEVVNDSNIKNIIHRLEDRVLKGQITATHASEKILDSFLKK